MIGIIIKLYEKLTKLVKKIFTQKKTVEMPISSYIKQNVEELKGDDLANIIQINLKNNSKDLFALSSLKEYAVKLWEISEQASRPLLVMIMGEFKTGKSTFINAILGEEILKSDVTPATAVVSMISYGEEKKVLAHFRDGSVKEYTYEELKDITAEGDSSKKELRSNIKYVELFIRKEILKSITIIDTPGLNVDNQLHIQATKEFMNEADMVFWVFAYGKAASRTEVAAISELSKRLKPMAIINRIDEIDEEEESLDEVIEDIRKRLKGHVEEFIGVSSFLAKKGIIENDEVALEESRWSFFTDKLDKEVLQKSENLKITSIQEKLFEYIELLSKFLMQTRFELNDMDKKFSDVTAYKKNILADKEIFNTLLYQNNALRKNKKQVTTDPAYLYQCWKNNNKSELDHVTIPLNHILKLVEVLKLLGGTEKIIASIQSYGSIYDNIIQEIDKILMRIEQLNKTDDQLSKELKEYESQVHAYNNSGLFGGAPLFDWHGKAKNLEKWKTDLNSKIESLKASYKNCESDRLNQFSRLTRMNMEIYDYLSVIDNVLQSSIKEGEKEFRSLEENFEAEKQRCKYLKDEIEQGKEVLISLVKVLKDSNGDKLKINQLILGL